MGMLMNRFNMLTQRRKDIKSAKDSGIDYNKFVLSGVIVHDTNDKALVDCMGNNFVRWAEMTGEHFLFITFIHPSGEWKNSKYCHDAYWIDKDNLMVDKDMAMEDEERTMPLLRDFMNLPPSGSYLMLTDNLCSNTFHKIPISAQTIEEQFLLITKYCEAESAGEEHSPADFDKLINELKGGEISIMTSLLDVLIDFTAVTSKLIGNFKWMNDEQLHHADAVIDKLRSNLSRYQGEDFEDRVFHLYECMEIAWRRVFSRDRRFHFPSFNTPYLDFPTKRCLDEYSLKLLETYNYLSIITKGHAEDLDYSGLTIYLGKIVENELHLSVGQMVRWAMGIDMPTYYGKYCKHKKKVVVKSGDFTVDINQAMSPTDEDSKQKGIAMGTLLMLYQTLYYYPEENDPRPDWIKMIELDSMLLNFLNNFSKRYRNKSAHLDSDSKQTYEGALRAFEDFKETYLAQLYEIKKYIKECDDPEHSAYN